MERMTPKRWNGLAWFRTKGYGKVLAGVVSSVGLQTHRVPPNTTRSTRQGFSVAGVTLHFHFFPTQGQAIKTGHARAHKTETAQATIQEEPKKGRCFAQDTF